MQNVYVGIENADISGHALRWAIDLVESIGKPAQVHAVHVARPAPSGFLGLPSHVPGSLEEERRDAAERELQRLVMDATGTTSIEVDALVAHGEPSEVLLDLARDADLLVLGATSKGRIPRVVLGSTSQRCVAAGEVPVAIIPPT